MPAGDPMRARIPTWLTVVLMLTVPIRLRTQVRRRQVRIYPQRSRPSRAWCGSILVGISHLHAMGNQPLALECKQVTKRALGAHRASAYQ
jgi:hypothetical protein